MSLAGDAFEPVWRVTMLPLSIAASVGRDSIEAGERAGRAVARSGEDALLRLLDDVMDALVDSEVLDRILARIDEAAVAQHIAQHMLESGAIEQIAERLFEGPELRRMIKSAFTSELPEELVTELLESEAVWVMVAEIAASPSVTEALTQQTTGFAGQVSAKARVRSRHADARVQRLAQRLGRRHRDAAAALDEAVTPAPGQPGGETAQ